ncbi:MAG: alanyl-tRNA editing protein [Chloroflexi bacterium]|nr:alanyl-tRNA editing protein [Chloroflexota bacterium]
MTERLYQTDSYLQEFEAVVTELDQENHGVILDRTTFYPGGGGQPADHGTLKAESTAFEVKGSKMIAGRLVHLIGGELQLPNLGTKIIGKIDWTKRFQLMRTHTAMHILCGVVFRDYNALVTGGNMEPLKGRMDFEFESMHRELINEIKNSINLEVSKGRDLNVKIIPRDEAFQIPDLIRTKINLLPEGIQEVRVVEIQGLDLQADGGTHVQNTSEVGEIKITDYKSKGKINKRIYVELPA